MADDQAEISFQTALTMFSARPSAVLSSPSIPSSVFSLITCDKETRCLSYCPISTCSLACVQATTYTSHKLAIPAQSASSTPCTLDSTIQQCQNRLDSLSFWLFAFFDKSPWQQFFDERAHCSKKHRFELVSLDIERDLSVTRFL